MNKTRILFKVLRKCAKGSGNENNLSGSSADVGTIIMIVLGILVAGLLGYIGYWIAPIAEQFGGSTQILMCLATLAGISCVFYSLKKQISAMYMSSDIDILLTMPLTPMQIVINRIMDVLISNYIVCALIFIPFTVGYSVRAPHLMFILFSLFLFLAVPLFTVCAVGIVVMLIMRLVRVFRSREVLTFFGVIVTVLLLLLYVAIINMPDNTDMTQIVRQVTDIVGKIQYVIPIVPLIGAFIVAGNVLDLVIALVILAAVLILFWIVAKTCYLDGAMNMINSASNGKRLDMESLRRACRKRTPLQAIRRKDFAVTTRTPSFLMNNYLLLWGWPVIAVIMIFVSKSTGLNAADAPDEAGKLFGNLMIINVIVPPIHSLLQLVSQIASRSFSREGADFICLKQYPVSSRMQIRAKRGLALRVFALGTIVYPAVLGIVMAISGSYSWLSVLYLVLLCALMTWFGVNMGVYFDLRRPNLNWSNEAEVGKGNAPFGIYILILVVIQLVLGVLGIFAGPLLLVAFQNIIPDDPVMMYLPVFLYSGFLLILYAAAALVSQNMMYRFGIKQLKRMTA